HERRRLYHVERRARASVGVAYRDGHAGVAVVTGVCKIAAPDRGIKSATAVDGAIACLLVDAIASVLVKVIPVCNAIGVNMLPDLGGVLRMRFFAGKFAERARCQAHTSASIGKRAAERFR